MAKKLSTGVMGAGCGLMGFGCLLMVLGIVGPIVVVIMMAMASAK